jgi:hypothetical protein
MAPDQDRAAPLCVELVARDRAEGPTEAAARCKAPRAAAAAALTPPLAAAYPLMPLASSARALAPAAAAADPDSAGGGAPVPWKSSSRDTDSLYR